MMESVWRAGCKIPPRAQLSGDMSADVVVIGAGMAGILCATLLRQKGAHVVVLEADRIGLGVTGNTTAKITSQHRLIYARLIEEFGRKKALMYAQANEKAIGRFAELIEQKQIECDFERKDAYVYTLRDMNALREELTAALELGIDAELTHSVPLPFEVEGALRFKNQAQFHPLKFVKALMRELTIFEQTMVKDIEGNTAVTQTGRVTGKHIIMTTHFPFINRPGYYFMRMHQQRSYVVALKHAETYPGMYIDEDERGLSFRNYGELLLFGGGGHRTGEAHGSSYEMLKERAKEFYPASKVKYEWSAQDCMSMDEIPYIGEFSPETPDVYVATGFNKWGMTSSMVTAMVLSERLTGGSDGFGEVFSPGRFNLGASAVNLIKDGAHTVAGLTQNLSLTFKDIEDIERGQAGIVEYDGRKMGAYRDEDGEIHLVDVRCPHLGCQLAWNPDERSWDCPCHGSRFDYRGRLINGPAMEGITHA